MNSIKVFDMQVILKTYKNNVTRAKIQERTVKNSESFLFQKKNRMYSYLDHVFIGTIYYFSFGQCDRMKQYND